METWGHQEQDSPGPSATANAVYLCAQMISLCSCCLPPICRLSISSKRFFFLPSVWFLCLTETFTSVIPHLPSFPTYPLLSSISHVVCFTFPLRAIPQPCSSLILPSFVQAMSSVISVSIIHPPVSLTWTGALPKTMHRAATLRPSSSRKSDCSGRKNNTGWKDQRDMLTLQTWTSVLRHPKYNPPEAWFTNLNLPWGRPLN